MKPLCFKHIAIKTMRRKLFAINQRVLMCMCIENSLQWNVCVVNAWNFALKQEWYDLKLLCAEKNIAMKPLCRKLIAMKPLCRKLIAMKTKGWKTCAWYQCTDVFAMNYMCQNSIALKLMWRKYMIAAKPMCVSNITINSRCGETVQRKYNVLK